LVVGWRTWLVSCAPIDAKNATSMFQRFDRDVDRGDVGRDRLLGLG
jgi:hypothetical protein